MTECSDRRRSGTGRSEADGPEQPFVDNLDLSRQKAWQILSEGASDRHSPAHTPCVGTVTADGKPSQRVMVLREADADSRLLRFNTDARVSKTADIAAHPAVSVLVYHPEAKIQLRVSGIGQIVTEEQEADRAWDQANLYGKRCYLADPAPGTEVDRPASGLPSDIEGQKPSEEEVRPARANFAILVICIDQIEWLFLAHTGHRRAKFVWDIKSKQWNSSWLIP